MSTPSTLDQTIHERPAELLQTLIRFDTTNPPGNKAQCVSYVSSLLEDRLEECYEYTALKAANVLSIPAEKDVYSNPKRCDIFSPLHSSSASSGNSRGRFSALTCDTVTGFLAKGAPLQRSSSENREAYVTCSAPARLNSSLQASLSTTNFSRALATSATYTMLNFAFASVGSGTGMPFTICFMKYDSRGA